jgi:PAS domain S-box-containing protein
MDIHSRRKHPPEVTAPGGSPKDTGTADNPPAISVLYVDDEPSLLEPTKLTLEKQENMSVDTATSVKVALEKIRTKPYDVIVSDYQMPETDGITFVKQLREAGNTIPFIIFTGKGREDAVIEAYDAGADFYLAKGGNPKAMFLDLTHKIEQVVTRRRAEEALRRSEEKYRSIFNTFDDLYYQTDIDGTILTLSPSCKRITGWYPDELIGSRVLDLYPHPEQRKQFLEELTTSGTVHDFEVILRNKAGRYLNVSVTSHLVHDGKGVPVAIEGTLRDVTERKQVEEALLASEEKYRTLADFLPVMIFEADRDGKVQFANRLTYPTVGIEPADVVAGINILDYIVPEERDTVRKNLEKLFSGEERGPNEYTVMRKNGSRFPAMIRASAIFDRQNHSISGLRGVIIDLTEHKQQEEALRQSEQQLHAIIDGSSIPQFVINRSHEVIYWNKALEKYSGIPAAEIQGTRDAWKAFYPEKRPVLAELLADNDLDAIPVWYKDTCKPDRYIEGAYEGTAFFPVMCGTGTWLHFSAIAIRDSRGEITGALEVLEDVSDTKRAEDALQTAYSELEQKVKERTVELSTLTESLRKEIAERNRVMEQLVTSEEKYRTLVEQIGDIVFHVDKDGFITYISPHVLENMGMREEQVGKINIFDLAPASYRDQIREVLDPARATHAAIAGFELVLPLPSSDKTVIYEVNAAPTFTKAGEYYGYSGIAREITERKNLQNTVNASLKEKEILLKEIHHRVKNNMQVISSLLNLQVKLMKDEKSREALLESQTRVMSIALVHEKLYQSKSFAEIDYHDYLKKITENLLQSYGVPRGKVRIEVHGENIVLPLGKAIPVSLIINELVSNSLKYAFPGDRTGVILIEINKKGDRYTLIVKDNGVGLPEGINLDKIQTLGLQLVNSLVGQLIGTIVLNRSGGTEFRIDFTIETTWGEQNE